MLPLYKSTRAIEVTTLDNISFYVGGAAVAQLQPLPSKQFGEAFSGQDIFPLTVIHARPGKSLSVQEYNSRIAGYKDQDDVFQHAFLQAIFVAQSEPNNVTAPIPEACASFTRQHYGTKVVMTTDSSVHGVLAAVLSAPIPSGPYFVSAATGKIFRAYRLYPDDHLAFTQPAVSNENGGFLLLLAITGDLMTRSVAVPSRLYYTRSASRPLAGLRMAVKDIFHVSGLKTSGGSRAYYSVYDMQNTTAASVQRLISLGAVLVGKTGTAQFANGDRPTADWVDVHCPFNPRGDGYQQPSGSSTGSAVAIAAYNWLDIAIGSDTGGSMRSPARLNGVFGNRPSTGAVSMDGVLPLSPHLDAAGVFARSAALWSDVAHHRYDGANGAANFSAYPRSIYVSSNSSEAALPEPLALFNAFVGRLERFLGGNSFVVNVRQHWEGSRNNNNNSTSANSSAAANLDELLNQTYAVLTSVDQYNLLGAPLLADYAARHGGARPFINPNPRARWAWGRAHAAQHADAVRNMTAFRTWWRSAGFGRPDAAACSEGVYVYMGAAGVPSYRDAYVDAPRLEPPLGFADWTIAGFAGAPEAAVPIGEVAYRSAVSGRDEHLPVVVNLLVARGCDGMLAAPVGQLEAEGIVRPVAAGPRLYPA